MYDFDSEEYAEENAHVFPTSTSSSPYHVMAWTL
jgi:hypothetical protein